MGFVFFSTLHPNQRPSVANSDLPTLQKFRTTRATIPMPNVKNIHAFCMDPLTKAPKLFFCQIKTITLIHNQDSPYAFRLKCILPILPRHIPQCTDRHTYVSYEQSHAHVKHDHNAINYLSGSYTQLKSAAN